MWNAIKEILKISLPFIAKIVEAKFIPESKKFLNTNLVDAAKVAISSATKLGEKVKDSKNEFDDMGFALALDLLESVGTQLLSAVAELRKIKVPEN